MKFEFEIPYIIGISLNRGTKKPRNPCGIGVFRCNIFFGCTTCVRTPVIIQFGVSYLQAGVGAKWVQIM